MVPTVPIESARQKQSIAPLVCSAELCLRIAKEHLETFSMRCGASDAATGAPRRQLPACCCLPDHNEPYICPTCQQCFCAGALQCESGAIAQWITILGFVLFPSVDSPNIVRHFSKLCLIRLLKFKTDGTVTYIKRVAKRLPVWGPKFYISTVAQRICYGR
jgi:hypothetical protein